MERFDQLYRAYEEFKISLAGDANYKNMIAELMNSDSSRDKCSGFSMQKEIKTDWVEKIEDSLMYLDKAIREQRQFIETIEEIVPIERCRKITSESVRHLAQHTNLIARVDGEYVTPEQILNLRREENFAIYENRFLKTLVQNVSRFVDIRINALQVASDDASFKLNMGRELEFESDLIKVNMDCVFQKGDDEANGKNKLEQNNDEFTRILKIKKILDGFLGSPLFQKLRGAEPVRPPITKTNMMKKNPNFQKAVELYTFIETYGDPGYTLNAKDGDRILTPDLKVGLYDAMILSQFIIKLNSDNQFKKDLEKRYFEQNRKADAEKIDPEKIAQVKELIENARSKEIKIREREVDKYKKIVNRQKEKLIDFKLTEARQTKVIKDLVKLYNEANLKHKKALKSLENQHSKEAERLAKLHGDEVTQINQQMTELENSYKSQIADRDKKMQETLDNHAHVLSHEKALTQHKIEKLQAQNEFNIKKERELCEEEIAKIQELRSKELAAEKEYWEKKMQQEKQDEADIHKREMKLLNQQHDEAMAESKKEFDQKLVEKDKQFAQEREAYIKAEKDRQTAQLADAKAKADAVLQDTREKHMLALKKLSDQKDAERDESVKKVESEMSKQKDNYETQLETLKKTTDEKLAKMRAYVTEQVEQAKRNAFKQVQEATAQAETATTGATEEAQKRIYEAEKEAKMMSWMTIQDYQKLFKYAQTIKVNKTVNERSEVVVFTDSICGQHELMKKLGVNILPIGYGKFDGVETLKAIQPFIENGNNIIFIGAGTKLSHTVELLSIIAEEIEYKGIYIVDSNTAFGGISILAQRAVEMVKGKVFAPDIVKSLNSMKSNVHTSFLAMTIPSVIVVRNSHIINTNGAKDVVNSLLKIGEDGRLTSVKQYKKGKEAFFEYIADVRTDLVNADDKVLYIWHTGVSDGVVNALAKQLMAIKPFKKLFVLPADDEFIKKYGKGVIGVMFFSAGSEAVSYADKITKLKKTIEMAKATTDDIQIMVDSSVSLSNEAIKQYNIEVIPEKVINLKADGHNLAGYIPILDFLTPYISQKRNILFISISKRYSHVCDIMNKIANDLGYKERMASFNSKNVSGALGILAIKASELAKDIKDVNELASKLEYDTNVIRTIIINKNLKELSPDNIYSNGGKAISASSIQNSIIEMKLGEKAKLKKFSAIDGKVLNSFFTANVDAFRTSPYNKILIAHADGQEEVVNAISHYLSQLGYFNEIIVVNDDEAVKRYYGTGSIGIFYFEGAMSNETNGTHSKT